MRTNLAQAISGFPNGEPQSTDTVPLPVSLLNELIEEIQDLRAAVKVLQETQDQAYETIAKDIAQDRKRLSRLEQKEPQPLQKDRGDVLRALIAAHGGKMLSGNARKMMHLSKQSFSNLLATVDDIDSKPYSLDKRQIVLVLR
jgi:hypothetical protein